MFFKAILASLAIGALSINALTIPVAREPAPEPDFQDVEVHRARDITTRPVSIFGDPKTKPKSKREPSAGKAKPSPPANKAGATSKTPENKAKGGSGGK